MLCESTDGSRAISHLAGWRPRLAADRREVDHPLRTQRPDLHGPNVVLADLNNGHLHIFLHIHMESGFRSLQPHGQLGGALEPQQAGLSTRILKAPERLVTV